MLMILNMTMRRIWDPELAGTILRIKQNDAETTRLDTYMPDGWNEIAWRLPGNMLGQNTKVTMLELSYGYDTCKSG